MEKIVGDDCKVYPIIVPTPYDVGDVNMFLLEETGTLTLIDAGIDSDDCWNTLNLTLTANGFTLSDLSQILITHSHQDHIGLINRISSLRDIPVYAHKESIPRLKRDPEFFSMRICFFDHLYREMGCNVAGEQHVQKIKNAMLENERYKINSEIIPLSDSDGIGSFKVIEVPGHAPDHISFFDAQRRWLFAGDHLIKHISSNAFVEPDREGNRKFTLVEYVHSLKKCLLLELVTTFSGHGELIHDHKNLIEMRLNRIEQKAEKILRMVQSGISTASELAQNYYPHKYSVLFSPVMSEIIGLLDLLEVQRKIQKVQRNHIWYYLTD